MVVWFSVGSVKTLIPITATVPTTIEGIPGLGLGLCRFRVRVMGRGLVVGL